MTQSSYWSLDFNYSGAEPPAPLGEAAWILDDLNPIPLPENRFLLGSKRGRSPVVVTGDVWATLQLCQNLRTIEDHAGRICQSVPPLRDQRRDVERVLATMAAQGVLLSGQELARSLSRPSPPLADEALSDVFIRTCDRADLLQRLLRSLHANERRFGNRYRYWVIDDSRSESKRSANREVIAAAGGDSGLSIRYHGHSEQLDLMETLSRGLSSAATASLHWLLAPRNTDLFCGGRAWNHALLLGAGKRLLLLDDDMLCDPVVPPGASSAVELSSRVREAFFFGRDAHPGEDWQTLGSDPLRQHATALGARLSHFAATQIREGQWGDALAAVETRDLAFLAADSPILLTSNGTFGDPGTATNHWLYDLDPVSRSSLIRSEEDYRVNTGGRFAWLGRRRIHLATNYALMTTTMTGVDNRHLMPPCCPQLRNEDFLFGALLQALYPRSLGFEFPWALKHLPDPRRSWDPAFASRPLSTSVQRFLGDVALRARHLIKADRPVDRLRGFATVFRDLSEAPESVLIEEMKSHSNYARADLVRARENDLAAFEDAPSFWREDVARTVETNVRALLDDTGLDPVCSDSRARPGQLVRGVLKSYADACVHWPQFWALAAENPVASPEPMADEG